MSSLLQLATNILTLYSSSATFLQQRHYDQYIVNNNGIRTWSQCGVCWLLSLFWILHWMQSGWVSLISAGELAFLYHSTDQDSTSQCLHSHDFAVWCKHVDCAVRLQSSLCIGRCLQSVLIPRQCIPILCIPYAAHVTNEEVRCRTSYPPATSLNLIMTRQLRLFGHITCHSHDSIIIYICISKVDICQQRVQK